MNTPTHSLARLLPCTLVAFAAALAPQLAQAAQRTVCSSGCTDSSIQDAVDAAADGDVIIVHEDRGESVHVDRDVQLTIRADWGQRYVLNANHADYAVYVGPDADVKLRGLDISGALVAGLFNDGGELRLVDATVHGNSAIYGGILSTGLLALSTGTSIYSNESTSVYAGGVNNFGGVVHTWGEGVSIIGNYGYNGGGLANVEGAMYLRECTVSGNSAYLGGGVYNSFGDLWISDTLIQSNGATSIGGGWSNHNLGGSVHTSNNSYVGNVSGSGQYVECYDVNGACGG